VRTRNAQEYAFNEQYVRPFLLKHYDFEWEDDYMRNGELSIAQALKQTNFHPKTPPQLRALNSFNREEADALVAYFLLIIRLTKQLHYSPYIEANHKLLQALRKEYHFEKE
jgi:hypothetical protein